MTLDALNRDALARITQGDQRAIRFFESLKDGTDANAAAIASLTAALPETVQAFDTTAGTAFDLTGLPAGVALVVLRFAGVSLSGTDDFLVQIGPAAGIDAAGYLSGAGSLDSGSTAVPAPAASTAGFLVRGGNAAAVLHGGMTLSRDTGNVWSAWHATYRSGAASVLVGMGGGSKTLAGPLSQVRLTRTGTNTFDAGRYAAGWRT